MPPIRRAAQLVVGLVVFALSMAMLIHAGQGAMPWDVLTQGIVRSTGLSFGLVTLIVSIVVLAGWIPLRQRPGIGTVANVLIISAAIDPWLAFLDLVLPDPNLATRIALAIGGIVLNGVSTAAYIGVRLGPGPRDGLMTGLVTRTGWSVRLVRTILEVVVVLLGWALGGTFGWATIAFAFGVGPVIQVAARWLAPSGLASPKVRVVPGERRSRRLSLSKPSPSKPGG